MGYEADRYSLVADVGGTNTRCALAEGRKVLPETVRRYSNAEFNDRGQGLDKVLETYIGDMGNVDCSGAGRRDRQRRDVRRRRRVRPRR